MFHISNGSETCHVSYLWLHHFIQISNGHNLCHFVALLQPQTTSWILIIRRLLSMSMKYLLTTTLPQTYTTLSPELFYSVKIQKAFFPSKSSVPTPKRSPTDPQMTPNGPLTENIFRNSWLFSESFGYFMHRSYQILLIWLKI